MERNELADYKINSRESNSKDVSSHDAKKNKMSTGKSITNENIVIVEHLSLNRLIILFNVPDHLNFFDKIEITFQRFTYHTK